MHAVLDRHGLVRRARQRRRHKAPGTPLSEATAPNALWCADFKGEFKLGNGQYCYPLTVTDQASRFLLCEALESTKEKGAFEACRQLFRERGLPELAYPFHDKEVLVTACGRICMHRKKINISTVMAGQRLGIKEVDDAIWLVSFMHHDLGYIDLEQKTLQTIDNPFGARLSPMS